MAEETKKMAISEAMGRAVYQEMERDESVIMCGQNVTTGGGWFDMRGPMKDVLFADVFGTDRVISTPMVEVAQVGMAIGACMNGLRPLIQIITAGILLTAFDELLKIGNHRQEYGHPVKWPLVIYSRCGVGGGSGADHCMSIESFMLGIPALKVVMPSTAYDAKGLMAAALRDDDPVLYLAPGMLLRAEDEEVPTGEYVVPIGKAVVRREGKDITIVSYAGMMSRVTDAAEELAKESVSAEVIDLRSIIPLDIDTVVKSVKKTGRLIIAHEAMKRGGVGAEVAMRVTETIPDSTKVLKAPIRRLAALNVAQPRGRELELACQPQVADIVKEAKEMV